MLNAISWQQFVTAFILLSVTWYIYVGLRYYRPELRSLLKISTKAANAFPAVENASASNPTASVMGPARPEPGTGLYAAEELVFSSGDTDDTISDRTLPKGPSDDLLAEAQILVGAFGETGSKTEFLSLLHILISKYAIFRDEIHLPSIIGSLRQFAGPRLPFELEPNEWPLTF
jgi:hypothetical protein